MATGERPRLQIVPRPRPTMTSSSDTSTPETRRARRKTLRTLGEIVAPGHDHGMECTVLDMSGTGARLRITTVRKAFQPEPDVPETFRLVIPRDNLVVDCRRAWRDGDQVGVSFSSALRPLKAAPPRRSA